MSSDTDSSAGSDGLENLSSRLGGIDIEQWFQDIAQGRARFVMVKSNPDDLKSWGERAETAGNSVFKKKSADGKRPVKWSLVAHLQSKDEDDDARLGTRKQSPEALSYLKNVDSAITWFSVPIIDRIPWKDCKDPGFLDRIHFAIEIPSTLEEKQVAKDIPNGSDTELTTCEADGLQSPTNELPERMLLNSLKLRRFLDYEFCDGTQPWSAGGPFVILRPFKILVYLRDKIKARINDFKLARQALWDASDEEYVKQYKSNPFEDTSARGRQSESRMTVSALTGWILDFDCLETFMDTFIEPQRLHLADVPESVRFSDLWYLFPAGGLVYVRKKDVQKVWKVVQRAGGRRYVSRPTSIPAGDYTESFSDFVLDCYYLDFDGLQYVPVYDRFTISSFGGIQSTATLSVMPFKVAVKASLVNKEELLRRATGFQELTKPSHRHYNGRSLDRTPSGEKLSDMEIGAVKNISLYSERIDSEVIVDFEKAVQEIPLWNPGSSTLREHINDSHEKDKYTDHDEVWDQKFADELIDIESSKWNQWAKEGSGPTDEEDLLLLPNRVFAFVLRTRTWACLQLGTDSTGQEQLKKIQPQKEPWEKLELPGEHKQIVQSLIDSHFSQDKGVDMHFDLVRGKGKGVIVLLHGVPGVGKTSTAECAAESGGRPLLPITCGDLGLTPGDVEKKLQQIFRLAQAWDCVMLLDEADIFLAQRTPTDMERNALVSVFLRTLEYYEGILFLTTNRVGVFDEAFKSRVHISLYYPPLSREQTLKIWRAHIEKASFNHRIEVDPSDLLLCANEIFERQSDPQFGPVWNGRQIRNAFQSAVALAGFHSKAGEPINLERRFFLQVFQVSDKFSNYVWTVRQRHSDAQWNQMNMTRRDDWKYSGPPGQQTGQDLQTHTQGSPPGQTGQMNRPLQFGQFPQSTFGQSMPQSATPFGVQTVAGYQPQVGVQAGMSPNIMQAQQMPMRQQAPNASIPFGGQSSDQLRHQPNADFQHQPGTVSNMFVG
ncbi:aaa family atpase [Fusarium sp. NRRL 52700]|nr:aaa family atpase [Fusarium sp. NRRL 52700]